MRATSERAVGMRFARCRPTVSPPGNTGPSAGRTIGPVRAADAILIGVGGAHTAGTFESPCVPVLRRRPAALMYPAGGPSRRRGCGGRVAQFDFSASPAVFDGLPPLSLR